MSLVEIARYSNRVQADLARLLLEAEGLEAVLFDTEINGFFGGGLLPVRLMTLDDEAKEALRLLAEEGLL
jgi:hypothetical protein